MRAQLVERAEGNPLFVEQMLALLRRAGPGGGPIAIPPTIQALLAARLDRLATRTSSQVDRRGIRGRKGVLGAAPPRWPSAGDGPRLRRRSTRSLRKELIRAERRRRSTGEEGFAFRHALIRDAAYESLTKRQPRRACTSASRLARGALPRAADRARGDARLSPRAGIRLPDRAGAGRRHARARSRDGPPRASGLGRPARRAAPARTSRSSACFPRASALLPAGAPQSARAAAADRRVAGGHRQPRKAGEVYAEALDAPLRPASGPSRAAPASAAPTSGSSPSRR